jgi:peptidoglycan/LPS O-acetylase OafA/YrhL
VKYRPEIDGLRAVAVLPVILFHAGYVAFSGGFVGVDVFFVISGYLITGLIAKELDEGSFSLRSFYERRARRIAPALFTVILVCVPVAWHILMPIELADFRDSIIAVSTFSSNVYFWWTSGYFNAKSEFSPLLHTWSLAVEEQYYIVFPMLLMFLWRRVRVSPIKVLSFLALASYVAAYVTALSQPEQSFFLFHTRSWELLVGGILALALRDERAVEVKSRVRQGLSMLGLALILGSVVHFDESSQFPGPVAWVPVLGTVLIIAFATRETWTYRLLSSRLLVGIGLISYGVYLWHQPIFAFAKYATHGLLGQFELLLLTLLPFPLAYATWSLIEQPVRNQSKVSMKHFLAAATSCGVALVLANLVAFPDANRDPRVIENPMIVDGDVGHEVFFQHIAESYKQCQIEGLRENSLNYEEYRRCFQSKQSKDVDVVIVGDSHAEHLFAGVAESLEDQNVLYLTRVGAPFLGSSNYEDVFEYIADSHGLSEVILAAYWSRIIATHNVTQWPEELVRTVEFLRGHGLRVTLAGDVAQFRFDAQECKYSLGPDNPTLCSAKDNPVVAFTEQEVFSRIANSDAGVSFVPLRDFLCTEGRCDMYKDRVLLYRDDNHLNIAGSIMLGGILADRLRLGRTLKE